MIITDRIYDITRDYLISIVDEAMDNQKFYKLLDQVLTELERGKNITGESEEDLIDRIDNLLVCV